MHLAPPEESAPSPPSHRHDNLQASLSESCTSVGLSEYSKQPISELWRGIGQVLVGSQSHWLAR